MQRAGHSIDSATDGELALEKMRDNNYDVVLMDLQMPKLDGLEAARQRRAYEESNGLPAIPIVALTASVLIQDKHAAQDAGMQGFANKPVDFPLLMSEVARVLEFDTNTFTAQHAVGSLSSTDETVDNDVPSINSPHIIDMPKAVKMWGSEVLVLKEVDKFVTDSKDKIDDLMNALISEDYEKAVAVTHSLKGTSGNLCLTTFYKKTVQLEAQANKNDISVEDVNGLRDAIELIEKMLSDSSLYGERAINESIDNELLLSHLRRMLISVEQNMLDEDELIFLRDIEVSNYKEAVSQILLDIDDFEFELAQQRILTLIEELERSRE